MAKTLLELSLADIVPPSIAEDSQIKAMMSSLDPELQSVSHDIREALIVSRIDELPEPVIDLLAWQWHVDFYDLARTLEMKRAAVKGSIAWHRKKGTVWAIRKALEMLGIDSEVVEWWKIPGARPYTFAVKAEVTSGYWSMFPDSKDVTAVIRSAVLASKSARSWLISLDTVIRAEIEHRLFHGIATFTGRRQSLRPELPAMRPHPVTTGIGACRSGKDTIRAPLPGAKASNLGAGVATLTTGFITIKEGGI